MSPKAARLPADALGPQAFRLGLELHQHLSWVSGLLPADLGALSPYHDVSQFLITNRECGSRRGAVSLENPN